MNIPKKIEKLIEQREKYAWSIMRADSDDCPYFEENESGNYVCHNDFEENVECPEEYIDTCQVGTQD